MGSQSCERHRGGKTSVEQSSGKGWLQEPPARARCGDPVGTRDVSSSPCSGGRPRYRSLSVSLRPGNSLQLSTSLLPLGFFSFPVVGENFKPEKKPVSKRCEVVLMLSVCHLEREIFFWHLFIFHPSSCRIWVGMGSDPSSGWKPLYVTQFSFIYTYIVYVYSVHLYLHICMYIHNHIHLQCGFFKFHFPFIFKKKKCSNGNDYKCIIVKFIFFK